MKHSWSLRYGPLHSHSSNIPWVTQISNTNLVTTKTSQTPKHIFILNQVINNIKVVSQCLVVRELGFHVCERLLYRRATTRKWATSGIIFVALVNFFDSCTMLLLLVSCFPWGRYSCWYFDVQGRLGRRLIIQVVHNGKNTEKESLLRCMGCSWIFLKKLMKELSL